MLWLWLRAMGYVSQQILCNPEALVVEYLPATFHPHRPCHLDVKNVEGEYPFTGLGFSNEDGSKAHPPSS